MADPAPPAFVYVAEEWERLVDEDGGVVWRHLHAGTEVFEDPSAGGIPLGGFMMDAEARAAGAPSDDLGIGGGGGETGTGTARSVGMTNVARLLDRQWMLPANGMVDNYVDPHPALVFAVQDTSIEPHVATGRAVGVGLYCTSQDTDVDGEGAYVVLSEKVGGKTSRVSLLRRIPVRADDVGIRNVLDAPPCAPLDEMRHVKNILRFARLSHWKVTNELRSSALLSGQLKLWRASDGRAVVSFSTAAAKKAVLAYYRSDWLDVSGEKTKDNWSRVRVEEHPTADGHVVIIGAVRGGCRVWRSHDHLEGTLRDVCRARDVHCVVNSITFGDDGTEEALVQLFTLGRGESVVLPLLKSRESGDDVEVTVTLPHGHCETLFVSFWHCVPLRVARTAGQFSDCNWEELKGAILSFVAPTGGDALAIGAAGPKLRSLALAWNENLLMSTEWRKWSQVARGVRSDLVACAEILVRGDGPLAAANATGLRKFVLRITDVGDSLVDTLRNAREVRGATSRRDVRGRSACSAFPWCEEAHLEAHSTPDEVLWDEARRGGQARGIIPYPFYERGVGAHSMYLASDPDSLECALTRFEAAGGLPVVRVRFDAADGVGAARVLCGFLCSVDNLDGARELVKSRLQRVVRLDNMARGLAGLHGPIDALCLGIAAVPCAIVEAVGSGVGVCTGESGATDDIVVKEALTRADTAIDDAQRKLRKLTKSLEKIVETKNKPDLNADQLEMIGREAAVSQDVGRTGARVRELQLHKDELLAWKPPTGLPLGRKGCLAGQTFIIAANEAFIIAIVAGTLAVVPAHALKSLVNYYGGNVRLSGALHCGSAAADPPVTVGRHLTGLPGLPGEEIVVLLLSELYAEIRSSLAAEDRGAVLAELAKERDELVAASREWVDTSGAWGFVLKSATCCASDVVDGKCYSTERICSFAKQGSSIADLGDDTRSGSGGGICGGGGSSRLRRDAPAPGGK